MAEQQGPEVEERSVGASANVMKQAGRKQSIAAIPGPRERCCYHYDAARRNPRTHSWALAPARPLLQVCLPPPSYPSDSFGFAGKCSRCGPQLAAAFAPTGRRSRDGRTAEPDLWTPPPPPPTGRWGTHRGPSREGPATHQTGLPRPYKASWPTGLLDWECSSQYPELGPRGCPWLLEECVWEAQSAFCPEGDLRSPGCSWEPPDSPNTGQFCSPDP